MEYSRDAKGKEILLKNGNLQVMMEWEKPYMQACIDALQPKGDVLEVGFGLGYSADRIQSYGPRSHTIIECDPVVLERAETWAADKVSAMIVEGTWQEQLAALGQFDQIFFDDYTPYTDAEVAVTEKEISRSEEAVSGAKVAQGELASQLEAMKEIRFGDTQVEQFCDYLAARPDVDYDQVMVFVDQLVEQGNITSEQKQLFMKRYAAEQLVALADTTVEDVREEAQAFAEQAQRDMGDRLITFLDLCLDTHMHTGSRLSAYIDLQQFRAREDAFRSWVEKRGDVSVEETLMDIEVPDNCQYYAGNQALVLVLTKQDVAQ